MGRRTIYYCDGCLLDFEKRSDLSRMYVSKQSGYYGERREVALCQRCVVITTHGLPSKITDWLGWTEPEQEDDDDA